MKGREKSQIIRTLSDIKKSEGDEEFTEKGSNVVVWENHGEYIQYKGTSTRCPACGCQITYYLMTNR